MVKKKVVIALAILMTIACLTMSGWAQSFNASIRGTVTDPSGASIPNVELTLKAVETKAMVKQSSSADGAFAFLDLATGNMN
jgi:hypothetical protein